MSDFPSVTPPMGDRRHPNNNGGALSLQQPAPAHAYPTIPPPIQPSGAVAQTPQGVPGPPPDMVPVELQQMVADGISQGVPVAAIKQYLPQLSDMAILRLAAERKLQLAVEPGRFVDAAVYLAQITGAPPPVQVQPMGVQPVAVAAPKQAETPSVGGGGSIKTRVTKKVQQDVAGLHAKGLDSSAIARELGLAPDTVMRALKKISEETGAATVAQAPTPEQAPVQVVDPRQLALPSAQPGVLTAADAAKLNVGDVVPGTQDVFPAGLNAVLNERALALIWHSADGNGHGHWVVTTLARSLPPATPPGEPVSGTGVLWNPPSPATPPAAWTPTPIAEHSAQPYVPANPAAPVKDPQQAAYAEEGYSVVAPPRELDPARAVVQGFEATMNDLVNDIVMPGPDHTHPIGAWLNELERHLNTKLAKYGLMGRIQLRARQDA